MVKRYTDCLGFDPDPYMEMAEDEDGDWVRYEDYQAEMIRVRNEALEAVIEKIQKVVHNFGREGKIVVLACLHIARALKTKIPEKQI